MLIGVGPADSRALFFLDKHRTAKHEARTANRRRQLVVQYSRLSACHELSSGTRYMVVCWRLIGHVLKYIRFPSKVLRWQVRIPLTL